eukprot:8256134-Lingulodinium_polyedra.AAC.1
MELHGEDGIGQEPSGLVRVQVAVAGAPSVRVGWTASQRLHVDETPFDADPQVLASEAPSRPPELHCPLWLAARARLALGQPRQQRPQQHGPSFPLQSPHPGPWAAGALLRAGWQRWRCPSARDCPRSRRAPSHTRRRHVGARLVGVGLVSVLPAVRGPPCRRVVTSSTASPAPGDSRPSGPSVSAARTAVGFPAVTAARRP